MTAVLITGASGFIARSLAPVLSQADFRIVGASHSAQAVPGFHAIYAGHLGDSLRPVLDAECPDAIVHTALASGADSYRVNVEGTTRWLEDGRTTGVPLQILLSSRSAAPDALSDYGRGKYALEQKFIEANQVVFRVPIVVGDGGMFARIRDSARRLPVVPLLDGARQTVYVVGIGFLCNVVRDAILGRGNGLRARVWNLHEPTPYTLREVIAAINRGYGYRRILLPVPAWAVFALLWTIEKLPFPKLPISSANLQGLIQGRGRETPSDFTRFGYPEEGLSALVGAVARQRRF